LKALDLDAIEACAHAATSGPWGEKPDDLPSLYSEAADTWGLRTDGTDLQLFIADEASAADVAFIRAARQNVPTLIARVRELEAREARVRAVIADQPRRHGDAPCSDACVRYVCNDVLGALA